MPPRPYQDYPSRFISIIEHFESTTKDLEFDLAYREAISLRHSFYRFLQALSRAAEANDQLATKLHKTAKSLSVRVIPARAQPDDPATLTFYINPLEKDMAGEKEPEDIIPLNPDELEEIIERKRHG